MPNANEQAEPSNKTQVSNPLANANRPPYDEAMEASIAKLEEFAADTRERLVKIETRLEQTATKADLANAVEKLTRYIGELNQAPGQTPAATHTRLAPSAAQPATK